MIFEILRMSRNYLPKRILRHLGQVVPNESQGAPLTSQERFRTEFTPIWERFCKNFNAKKEYKFRMNCDSFLAFSL